MEVAGSVGRGWAAGCATDKTLRPAAKHACTTEAPASASQQPACPRRQSPSSGFSQLALTTATSMPTSQQRASAGLPGDKSSLLQATMRQGGQPAARSRARM